MCALVCVSVCVCSSNKIKHASTHTRTHCVHSLALLTSIIFVLVHKIVRYVSIWHILQFDFLLVSSHSLCQYVCVHFELGCSCIETLNQNANDEIFSLCYWYAWSVFEYLITLENVLLCLTLFLFLSFSLTFSGIRKIRAKSKSVATTIQFHSFQFILINDMPHTQIVSSCWVCSTKCQTSYEIHYRIHLSSIEMRLHDQFHIICLNRIIFYHLI